MYLLTSLFPANYYFSLQGNEAPKDTNPSTLTKAGKKRANPAQFIPRTSKELQGNLEDYHQLQAIFEPLLEWIASVVSFKICLLLISFSIMLSSIRWLKFCQNIPRFFNNGWISFQAMNSLLFFLSVDLSSTSM